LTDDGHMTKKSNILVIDRLSMMVPGGGLTSVSFATMAAGRGRFDITLSTIVTWCTFTASPYRNSK